MSLEAIKLLAALAILIIAVIAGWLPLHRKIRLTYQLEFPRGEALASGVFLGAALIHMLSDANNGFHQFGFKYPLAFLICGASFLVLLLLEHFGNEIKHHGGKNTITLITISFIMLSLHSLFAGAALGLTYHLGTTLLILLAILAHKWAASFVFAVQIHKSRISASMGLVYFGIFAISTPLGILLGNSIHQHAQNNIFAPIFTAIAAGTFLYIGTLHGLKRSVMVERCCNLRDFSFVIIGFVLMAVVALGS